MDTTFDILDLRHPFPFYQWARKNAPVFLDEKTGYWVVSKYQDIKNILSNENFFSAELERVNFSKLSAAALDILNPINFEELFGLSTTENPAHDRVKRVALPIFNDLFSASLKPQLEAIIGRHIDRVQGRREFDVVNEVFNPLPAEVIFTILGISPEDVSKVKEWSESRVSLTWGTEEGQVEQAKNIVKYWDFCKNLVDEKAKEPRNDLPSRMIPFYQNGTLSLQEIQLLCYGLVFSGHATTSAFLAESLRVLLETGWWNKILTDKIPFSSSVEEMLRYCPSAFTRRRLALEDVIIGNVKIAKGGKILLSLGSGNRDEEVFDDPEAVQINRLNASRHLTFGNGFHYCIGAKLVKLEYSLVMEMISQAFPKLRLSEDNRFEYSNNISIRSLKQLKVIH